MFESVRALAYTRAQYRRQASRGAVRIHLRPRCGAPHRPTDWFAAADDDETGEVRVRRERRAGHRTKVARRRHAGRDGLPGPRCRADGRGPHRPDADRDSTSGTASTARAARGPRTPDSRKLAEFCENGAKAVAEEATTRDGRRRSSSPRTRSPSWPSTTDYWLGQQGRLTHPMVLRAGRRPLRADQLGRRASTLIAEHLRGARHPRRGGLLHLGPHQQRGRVPLPAVRPQLRHQQPARLLEHVPRVVAAPRWPRRSASARAR